MSGRLVSIVIASIRRVQLDRCLESIRCHTQGINYEIVVVSPFDIEADSRLVHIREDEPRGYYNAVTKGYEAATGKYIIHIADDCRATPGWATNMIAFMKLHDGEVFEGSFRHFDVRGERPEQGHYGKLIAPFICIYRDTVTRVGGLMDDCYKRFFGDPDLSLRVWHHGGEVQTCPDAWIYHCDFDDEQYNQAYDQYFVQDRETFLHRWYHILGRPGDTQLGHQQPLKQAALPDLLPPEQCAKLYLSLRRKEWKTMRDTITSEDSADCVYPEGFLLLYDLLVRMLRNPYHPRDVLCSVLEWLDKKGYEPAGSTLESERDSPSRPRLLDYCMGTAIKIANTGIGRLVSWLVPKSLVRWIQSGWS